jgi:hypothetical protein
MLRIGYQRSLIPWEQAVSRLGLVLALVLWTVLAADKVSAELSDGAREGPGTGAGLGQVHLRIPEDSHRHGIQGQSDRVEHLPPSTQVVFIIKTR